MDSGLTLAAVGPIAIAARVALREGAEGRRGERRLTIVAKATCEIVHEAPLEPSEPRPIVVGERCGEAPGSSITHPGDVGFSLPRAQILVVGAAYTEGGIPQTMDTVRLVVSRGSSTLVDKRLSVVGDRRGPARSVAPGGPERVEEAVPFLRVPLVYERAFGGSGFVPNPVGTGIAADRDGRAFLPNVYHPHGRASFEPPGFGPISSSWTARRRLLGDTPASAADVDVVARLSAGFDAAYFMSAPSDQQIERWEGGETIGLHHLHPSWPWLYFDVPRWGVAAVLTDRHGARTIVAMPLDTVLVTPEELSVELTYRGSVELERDTLRGARVDVALVDPEGVRATTSAAGGPEVGAPPPLRREETQKLDLPPGWRDDAAGSGARSEAGEPRVSAGRGRGGTMVLESTPPPTPGQTPRAEHAEPPQRPSRTHSGTMILEQAEQERSDPAVVPALAAALPLPFAIEDESTLVLAEDEVAAPARELPAAAALGSEVPSGESPRPRAVTVSIDARDEAPPSMPFEGRARKASASNRPAAPIPGAPWSADDGPRPRPADGIEQTDGDVTHAGEPIAAVEPAVAVGLESPPSPAGPLPAPAPASAPEPRDPEPKPAGSELEPRRDPWRVDPPEPALPAASPEPPRRNFKAGLYKNIKR